jgi:transposase-like protein
MAVSMSATNGAEFLIPFFRQLKQQYGNPVALVHDMGQGILSAVNTVFKGIPDFICHFHFLRDIGKDLFEKEHSTIRDRLKKHKIRSLLKPKGQGFGKNYW